MPSLPRFQALAQDPVKLSASPSKNEGFGYHQVYRSERMIVPPHVSEDLFLDLEYPSNATNDLSFKKGKPAVISRAPGIPRLSAELQHFLSSKSRLDSSCPKR